MRIVLIALILNSVLLAEEVLSSHPVVISPKRIETETQVTGKPAKRSVKTRPAQVVATRSEAEPPEKSAAITVDEKNIVMKISFRRGSIQLSKPIRKQLKALDLKPGQKIRISGFGETGIKKADKLANLRARVVASFLKEAVGDIEANLQWTGKPHPSYSDGAVIELVN